MVPQNTKFLRYHQWQEDTAPWRLRAFFDKELEIYENAQDSGNRLL
jgi:hypothetical protein